MALVYQHARLIGKEISHAKTARWPYGGNEHTAEAYEAWQFVLMCVHPTPIYSEQLSQLIGSQETRFAKAKIQGFISRRVSRDFPDASHG